MRRALPFALTTALVVALIAAPAAADHSGSGDHQHPPAAAQATGHDEHAHSHDEEVEGLGAIRFPSGCKAEVQPAFDRGIAFLHSFGYHAARAAFQEVAAADPSCAMARWGEAMTWWHPLWAPPTADELSAGLAAARAAAALPAPGERERAYVAAIGTFYRDADTAPHGARAAAYRDAMRELADRFPEDDEARIFYALALLGTAPPTDASLAQQRQAAKLLEELLPEHPRHPGIAHYVIHSFDYPELAELALPAARAYAAIAPGSAHARHMPSHIFVRLGLWDESIRSNLDSAANAQESIAQSHPGAISFDTLHAWDYLAYAHLQLGHDAKAREVADQVAAASKFYEPNFAAAFALTAVPARYALERRRWEEAAALRAPAHDLPWDRFPYVSAATDFAVALGSARLGDATRARAAVDRLAATQARLAASPPAGPYDWAGHVEALRLAAAGWLARAERRDEEAIRLLTQAAELDERVGKHPVTPGAVLPPRELLGDLLLELGRPAEALAAYEAALVGAPNRLNGLLGAMRAAEGAGQKEKAEELAGRLRALCRAPECEREGLAAAPQQAAG